MAVSRHRKKPNTRPSKQRSRQTVCTETLGSGRPIRIKRHKFAFLKKDEDFVAIIKVGRLVNAVSFGMEILHGSMDTASPLQKRQYNRALFLTGGYLHEGMELVASLYSRFQKEPFFEQLKLLRFDESNNFTRKILREMRNSVAFHLDHDDKSTRAALAKLKLPRYDLASGGSNTVGEFYFDLSDTIDFNYLIDVLKGERSEQETSELIVKTVAEMMKQFLYAGHRFLAGLAEKMNILDHTD